MNIKPRPNHKRYIETLRRMTPAQRLEKSFELTEFSRQLLKDGLRRRHSGLSESQVQQLFVNRLHQCHSKNY
jgi:hypothetical protein